MWIQVRTMDGQMSSRIDGLSKLTKIEDLRILLVDKFNAPVAQQRLFYRGKQMEDGHTLFDYNVGLNEIIQIMVKPSIPDSPKAMASKETNIPANKENIIESKQPSSSSNNQCSSSYFNVGELIDAKDLTTGAWFEAKIINIQPSKPGDKPVLQSRLTNDISKQKIETVTNYSPYPDGLIYKIVFEDYEECEDPIDLSLLSIRPRAKRFLKCEELKCGDRIMVNYNIEEPTERGFWYDGIVQEVKRNRTSKHVIATILIGPHNTEVEDCKIIFTDEIFAIETNTPKQESSASASEECVTRLKKPKCNECKDIPTKKCKVCSCCICGGKDSPEKQIICDECDLIYHLWCLKPVLNDIPKEDEWFCPDCKNDTTEVVRAGEKLKASKKKSKMASATSTSSRDWGKGMATQGRTKECTIVPPNHFGPIPGVEVGSLWKFRIQVSETGVHRPHVAGIHGRESEGAYSIVLSGGYEDDLDEGDEFKYTGSGGRDLSGNKRCAEQSCDQTLTRMNKALALNCNAPLNKNGAESTNWQKGKPVRVVRNCKGRKHSEYCPEEGNRYDGIYKIVKYWPEKGKSGFLVWRYLLRRDDPAPAPWTKAGKKKMKDLGLTMQYPEGYLESLEDKEKNSQEKKMKRSQSDAASSPARKKQKTTYKLPSEISKAIDEDDVNKKLWDDCLEVVSEGYQAFVKKVEDCFACICCQEIVYHPVTTVCCHNICKSCLERSFKAEVYNCPMCRQELEKGCVTQTNKFLKRALLLLFPGYENGR